MAQRIAREIRGWVDAGRPLAQRGRAVRPDDVLILVQTRGPLFHEIIRALNGEGLPTPGADRLLVTTHIAILDLLALGDVLLNTGDDLQLAALLRSPLFEVSEDELFVLAHGREGRLWAVLKARHPAHAELAWRATLDTGRPYDIFAHILMPRAGLALPPAVGPEVDDLFSDSSTWRWSTRMRPTVRAFSPRCARARSPSSASLDVGRRRVHHDGAAPRGWNRRS